MRFSLNSLRRSLTPRPAGTSASPYPPLGYPIFPAPRMAVLGWEVQPAPGIHCLVDWTPARVARIRPLALAAAFPAYVTIAAMVQDGEIALPELRYPLLVFSRPGEGALSPEQHDAIWSWFGLPCFEQIRDGKGRLLAQECEAREGFHLTGDTRPGELGGRLMHTLCGCGQVTPRVRIAAAQVFAAKAGD